MRMQIGEVVLVCSVVVAAGLGCSSDDATTDASRDSSAVDSAAVDSAADTGAADTSVADTGTADTSVPDTGTADTSTADTGTGDTGTADTGAADTGFSCTANAAIRCDGATLESCNGAGDGVVRVTCDDDCNTSRLECNACTPSADFCVDTMTIATCNADGTVPAADTSCIYGCNAARAACNDCVPSTMQCQTPPGGSLPTNAVTCNADGTEASRVDCTTLGLVCLSGVCTPGGPRPDSGVFP